MSINVLHINSFYKSISKEKFSKEKFRLQKELLKLQEWIIKNDKRIAILFEGRDAAGKGAAIRLITQHLNNKYFRVEELGKPTEKQNRNWFNTFYKMLPKKGELVFFDRSWYSRALIQPTMGYCSLNQYDYFMRKVLDWEQKIKNDGIIIIKFYLSIDKSTQNKRFNIRKNHALKYWKLSKNDIDSITYWEELSGYKNRMFSLTSTENDPWIVVNSNNKIIAQLNCIRYLLDKFKYDKKKQLSPKKWTSTVNDRDIEIMGVKFYELNDDQYQLLSMIRHSL